MGFSEDQRAAHAATWDAAVSHPFVEELWAGTVDDAVLARYLTQDLQFLDAFVALLGQAVASADRPAPRLVLARQLGLISSDEDDYFVRALDRLGVSVEHRADPPQAAPTRGFLALMHDARTSADYGQILALLVVAEWLYLDWASRGTDPPVDWLYRGWIDLHRGPAFEEWTAFLRAELDRVAEGTDRRRLAATFGRAVELELAFFDAAYRD